MFSNIELFKTFMLTIRVQMMPDLALGSAEKGHANELIKSSWGEKKTNKHGSTFSICIRLGLHTV